MKKFVSVALSALLAVGAVASLASCGGKKESVNYFTGEPNDALGSVVTPATPEATADQLANVKIGMICLHDESSTYDNNFLKALNEVKVALGLSDSQVIIKTNIGETAACTTAANELADQGCNVIFADSFGHESYMLEAAKTHANVQFCHATGTQANTANQANFHNAFASIYEGRFLAGVAAGLKLNEMNASDSTVGYKMGYVGAFPYAEVISGFTSFYLGAKYVAPEVTMSVRYTNSWYDLDAEKKTAETLIDSDKCVLISQHADSMGAPNACEAKKVPNVAYNGSTQEAAPNSYLIYSRINWAPYFDYIIKSVAAGQTIATDWTGTLASQSVEVGGLNENVAAAGTQAKLDEVKAKLIAGTLQVFDTNTFTVNGNKVTGYMADIEDDGTFSHETQVIGKGYFHESLLRSAPAFDFIIDGITNFAS